MNLTNSIAPTFPSNSTKSGIALDSKEGSITKFDRLSGVMGDNIPEEPEACVVNPGNFSSSSSRVLNHRCVTFHGRSLSHHRYYIFLLYIFFLS